MLPGNIYNVLAVAEEERLEEIRLYNLERRIMRDSNDPFALSDEHFQKNFRLTKDMAHNVLNRILPEIHRTANIVAIHPVTKFFCALKFFATGSYQRIIGQSYNISISQQSVSRAIEDISAAIVNVLGEEWVKFPTTVDEKTFLKIRFMEATQFPGTIGAIDCTHVAIIAPPEEEHNYLNRKNFHSKNVQIICSYDLKILNVNARYAGATHDAYIWRHSIIRRELQQCYNEGDTNTWLLGDSGYPLEPWLMTPIINALPNTPEYAYTNTHVRARNCVERCIGVLKGRFRCIMGERKLRYSPDKVGKIVNACAILHNICVEGHLNIDEDLIVLENNNFHQEQNDNIDGHTIRRNLINRYFR